MLKTAYDLMREYQKNKKKIGVKTKERPVIERTTKKRLTKAQMRARLVPIVPFKNPAKEARFQKFSKELSSVIKKRGMTLPMPYQMQGIFLIGDKFKDRALIADSMGLGKSLVSLYRVKVNVKDDVVIVVCPVSVKKNWKKEAWNHCRIQSTILSGSKGPRRGRIHSAPRILIINYDILDNWVEPLKALNPKMIILDESDSISNPYTARYKAVKELCEGVPHLLLLTGTPIRNRIIELWTQLNLLRPDIWDSYTDFGDYYCEPTMGRNGIEYKGHRHLDELNRDLRKHCMIRRIKADVYKNHEPKKRKIILVQISDMAVYEDARDNFLAWLTKEAPHKVAGAARAEGLVRIGYLIRLAAKLKKKPCREWIRDFLYRRPGRKIIIFAVHKFMVRGYYERYKNVSLYVDGSITGPKRQDTFDKFTREKRWRILFGNIRAAGVGWNGDAANHVCLLQLPWTPGAAAQGEDRIDRLTQSEKCYYTYLLAAGTIEERLAQILEQKQQIADAVLDGKPMADGIDIYTKLIEALRDEAAQSRKRKKIEARKAEQQRNNK